MIDEKPLSRLSFGGRQCTLRKQHCEDGSTLYSFVDDSGDSQMKVYSLLPGINLIHHSVHIDRSYLGAAKKGNVIEIHHCLEGRIECSYENGHLYLTPGDLAVEIVERDTQEFEFPLRHYHGITISINTDIAPKCFSCLLKDVDVQPRLIARRLCRDRRCFVIRSKEYIDHLFSEMYVTVTTSGSGKLSNGSDELAFTNTLAEGNLTKSGDTLAGTVTVTDSPSNPGRYTGIVDFAINYFAGK